MTHTKMSDRLVALDLETTGLDTAEDRIIQIGMIELIDNRLSGNALSQLVNPQVSIPTASTRIHGIKNEDIAGKSSLLEKIDEIMKFIDGCGLIMHNADFDRIMFINELKRYGFFEKYRPDNLSFHDTLLMSRDRFPGQRNDLSSVCSRLGIATADRDNTGLHDALADARLTASVFIHYASAAVQLEMELSTLRLTQVDESFGKIHKKSTLVEITPEQTQLHKKFRTQYAEECAQDLRIEISNPIK